MFEFYQTLIDEHRETLDVDNVRDLIDVYLVEIEKAKAEGISEELFEGRDHGKYLDDSSSHQQPLIVHHWTWASPRPGGFGLLYYAGQRN